LTNKVNINENWFNLPRLVEKFVLALSRKEGLWYALCR
jgi:hypothetical protein